MRMNPSVAVFRSGDRSRGDGRRRSGRHGRVVGDRRSGRAQRGLSMFFQRVLELAPELVLGSGLVDAGAPQLICDKEQEEDARRDQDAAGRAEESPHASRVTERLAWAGSTHRADRSYTRLSSTARRRVCPPSSVSAPPSVCWTAFPRSRGRSRRRRGRDRAPLRCKRRGQDHVAAAARGARAALLGRSDRPRPRPRSRSTQCSPRPRARGPRDLLLRRPDRAGEPALRCSCRGASASAADAALERVGLVGARDVVHRRLSAGQRRRLALAVAWSRDPGSCSSTSRTPGSTRKVERCSTRSFAPHRPKAARCSSHPTSSTAPARSRTAKSCSPPAKPCCQRRRPRRAGDPAARASKWVASPAAERRPGYPRPQRASE